MLLEVSMLRKGCQKSINTTMKTDWVKFKMVWGKQKLA